MSIKLDNPHTVSGRTYCEGAVVYLETGTKEPLIFLGATDEKDVHVIDGVVDIGYDVPALTFISGGSIVEFIGMKGKIEVKVRGINQEKPYRGVK